MPAVTAGRTKTYFLIQTKRAHNANDTTCDNLSISSLDSNPCLDVVSAKDEFRFHLSYRGKLRAYFHNMKTERIKRPELSSS